MGETSNPGQPGAGSNSRPSGSAADASSRPIGIEVFTRVGYEENLGVSRPSEYVDTAKLYSGDTGETSAVGAAIRILAKAIDLVTQALEYRQAGEEFRADDLVGALRLRLEELLCFDDLGDGFGAAINACLYSIENLKGMPANDAQLGALAYVLGQARAFPFSHFERALTLIERLEQAGLAPDPPALGDLVEALSG